MGARITGVRALDVRFPTSRGLHGSDAMNPDPDYSVAYVVLETDAEHEGHGFTFTIGRGTDLVVAAVRALAPQVVGRDLDDVAADPRAVWHALVVGDSQLRWLGPEKGVVHLAAAALVNAVWDLWARAEGKPLWRLLADMEPERLVACAELSYVEDALSREEAVELVAGHVAGREERAREMAEVGFPAYTTSTGWLGYPDEEVRRLARQAVADGWGDVKMKVGGDPEGDARRAGIIREEIGAQRTLMMDANQVWGVREAIERMQALAPFDPYWIEEPTSPDDILGHAAIARAVAPVRVATGEHCHNRVMFKQLLQAGSIGVCQVDSCRLAGVNEVLTVLLLAAKFGVPVCPHAGGVGLCELTQHLSVLDYVAISADLEGRRLEYVDHLHEHFLDPVRIEAGRYLAPSAPGYSAQMHAESLEEHAFPDGSVWRG
jgi:L-fuconate dehydratase